VKKGDKIFVYGTLRPGQGSASYMAGRAKHLSSTRVNGLLYELGWFPGMKTIVPENEFITEAPTVIGDLFEIEHPGLPDELDSYEGYPSLYDRKELLTEEGVRAWTYIYQPSVEGKDIIPTGDWANAY
jgi:gamma-glutamylcyclotransferase (GGCT)/AIG2-like uncharacterized protein YtfP